MLSLIGQKVDAWQLARDVFCFPVDMGACEKLIAEQTEGMTRDELAKYAAGILFGLLSLKQDILNTKLFGKKDVRF